MVRKYKHTELGDIPVNWKLQTFEETFRVLSNNTLSRDNLNNSGGAVRNIHYGDILTKFSEVLDCGYEEIPYINDLCLLTASTQLLQDGDVIIADTAEDETVGKATEIRGLGENRMIAGLHTIPCRVKKGNFAPGWLGYYMNSDLFHDQIRPFITGIKVSSISKTAISETLILIPPIEEQARIVESMDDITNLIRFTNRTIDKFYNFKQGCLSAVFPKKGESIPEMRDPEFADAWEWHRLSEISTSFEYGLNAAAAAFDGKNKYIRITDIDDSSHALIRNGITSPDTDLSNADNYKLSTGDILLARTGASVGKSYIYKPEDGLAYYAGFLIRARIKEGYNPEFIFQNTLTADYKRYIAVTSQRSGQPGVNAQEYGEYKIMVPDKLEQDRISTFLRNIDDLIALHQRNCEKYRNIKRGMMSELVTGRTCLV